MFSVSVSGGRLNGEVRGEHPALVFIHGFGGSLTGWNALWQVLPPDLAMLRYDLRGFGASAAEDGAAFSHADDLLALLDDQGIERADLVGLSMGGGIAVNFALDHPARVRRLVLVSPALQGWEWSAEWREIWRATSKCARGGDMAGARELWWQHPFFASTRAGPAAGALRTEIDAFAGKQWRHSDERAVLPDLDRLHQLSAPTLLLTGALDFPDFRLIGDLLEAAAPDLRRVDFADAGHMLHLERAEDVAREIMGFMGS